MTLKRADFLIFLVEISEYGHVCHVFFSLPFVCVCVCVFQTKVRFCRRIGALLLFWLCAVTLVPLQSDCFLFSWCRIWLFLWRFVSSDESLSFGFSLCLFVETFCLLSVSFAILEVFGAVVFFSCDSTCRFFSFSSVVSDPSFYFVFPLMLLSAFNIFCLIDLFYRPNLNC